ncbi:MAG TPA: nucleotide sugar dehydrogenase [Candidatus Nanoarchaeia archaeon]|nr:nucleotide sugar dehydrogenase [Candidatus Nanoarchaeia archaeon]
MIINVIGLGKAGLPLAAVIADADLTVNGIDVDRKKVDMINSGKNPIPEEPGLSEIIKRCSGKNLKAFEKIPESGKDCAYIVIVPLFISHENVPDFSMLKSAFENVGKKLKKTDLVVLETTVPVKTTEVFVKNILEKESGLKAGSDFYLAYSPERIMTGYSISRFREFPKIVGGIDKKSTEKAFEVYSKFTNPVKVSNSRTAELAKISEGVYRDVNIALANELLKVSESYGIDFWEMREAARHQYCNILEPGNVGGHCIPVYPWFIINELKAPLMKTARELNDSMIEFYADKLKKLKAKKVGIIGLSYREGVKEKAYSRSVDFINLLKKKGYEVYGLDPLYSKEETEKEFNVKFLEKIEGMDAVVLMNKEKKYDDILRKMKEKVIDIKNQLK